MHAFFDAKTVGSRFVRTDSFMTALVFIEPVLNGRSDPLEFPRIDDNETRKGRAVIRKIWIKDCQPAETTHFPAG